MRLRWTSFVAIAGLSLVVSLAAQARTERRGAYRRLDVGPYVHVPVRVCRPMCPLDASPCDPVYFKTADGRCAGVGAGR